MDHQHRDQFAVTGVTVLHFISMLLNCG